MEHKREKGNGGATPRTLGVERWCVRSRCNRWRWLLGRRWDRALPVLLVVGLNPSTADGATDDPTTRRCIGLAARWGFGGLLLANLYGWRSPHPIALRSSPDPVGAHNDAWLARAHGGAAMRLAAWGNHGLGPRHDEVLSLGGWWTIGRTKLGAPRHPLYAPREARPVRWEEACEER